MARDGAFFRGLGYTSPRTRVPTPALLIQGAWAAVLTLIGSFQQLFTAVVFTAWIFYGPTVAALIVLHLRYPHRIRSFRTPGYPALPILFVLAAAAVVVSSIVSAPAPSATGLALILLGLPLYLLFRRLEARTSKTMPCASEIIPGNAP